MFNQAIQFLQSHPATAISLASAILSVPGFLFNNVISVMVSDLPAPTKDSTKKYVFWFKVANSIIGNLKRANIPRIEDSPNWQAAVDAYVKKLADSGLIVVPSPSVTESKP